MAYPIRPPTGRPYTPGEIAALPYLYALLRALQQKERAHRAPSIQTVLPFTAQQ